jgi:uncharacterized protein involved in exopolysaccharide biosynthesis
MTVGAQAQPSESAFDAVYQSLIQTLRSLEQHKSIAVALILGGGVVGAGIALLTPNQYTSSATFIAQGSQTLSLPSVLQGAVASLGLERGSDYSPKFYADLLTSRPILQSAILHQYTISDGSGIRHANYLNIEGFDRLPPDRGLERAVRHLANRVGAGADVRTNMITLSVRARTPELSRDIVRQLLDALDSLNIGFRQFQSRESRTFFQDRADEARRELDSAEAVVRDFLQRNRVAGSPALQFEQQRLQREAELKQVLYATVMQQYEQARLQEARNVPTLTVLAEPSLPVVKSYPPRRLFVAIGMMVGALILWLRLKIAESRS